MNAKERDKIAYDALCYCIENHYVQSDLHRCDCEDTIKEAIDELNNMIKARNLYAKKFGYKTRKLELKSEWVKEWREYIKENED